MIINSMMEDPLTHILCSSIDFTKVNHLIKLGKILIDLNFRDINKIKPYLNDKIFRKLVQ
jgi:hypothetical protein